MTREEGQRPRRREGAPARQGKTGADSGGRVSPRASSNGDGGGGGAYTGAARQERLRAKRKQERERERAVEDERIRARREDTGGG